MGFAMPGSKPWEFYAAIVAAAMYVFDRAKEHTLIQRTVMVAASAVLGFALAPDLSAVVGWSETIIGVVVTTLAYPVLDLATALASDRKIIADIIKSRLK